MKINANGQQKQSVNSFVEPESEIKRYLRILNKRKWLIGIIFFLIFSAWTAYVIMFNSKPVYTASVLLNFQDARKVGALEGENNRRANESRVTPLKTNSLLGNVVEELQLNISIMTENVDQEELFNYLNITFNSAAGLYRITKTKDQPPRFKLHYTTEDAKSEKEVATFSVSDTVRLVEYGLEFQLNQSLFADRNLPNVEFKIRETDRAILSLRNSISYTWADRRNATFLEISVTHIHPARAALIANTLARHFVEFDASIKNRKSSEAEKNLLSQLEIARQELETANQKLQEFRERNPDVVEGRMGASLVVLEQNRSNTVFKQNEIQQLIKKLQETNNFDEKLVRARELMSYLVSDGLPSATAFSNELNMLVTARNTIQNQQFVSPTELRENEEKFNKLFSKIVDLAKSHIVKLDNEIEYIDQNITLERRELRTLPRKERELTALVRDQQLKQQLYETIQVRYNQAKLSNEVEVGDVFIMDEARVPPLQSKWKIVFQKSLIGLVLGLGLGIVIAIVLEFFDKTVQTAEDLEGRLRMSVLGSIPVIYDDNDVPDNVKDIKGKRDAKLITLDYSPTLESESYRDLRTKLLFLSQKQKLGSFVMTSLRPNEGKSLTCANLAITFAQQKISTLLIDADLRRGVLHNVFGNRKKPGLGDFLVSKATVDYENVKKLIQKTIIPNLHLITTGSPIPNPTEMLGSERMSTLLNLLKSHYGMVILDTAPFQASSDAPILTRNVDGMVVVVRADYTNVEQLEQKLHEYSQIQDKLLGLILNMVKTDVKKERYQYSYYNY